MPDPFKIDSPTCISFSGGRTSAYMLWRVLQSNGGLPSEAVVCFANTGKEEEATLRFVRDCSERWSVPITWVEYGRGVVDFETASRNGEPFSALIEKKHYLPNPIARFCTSDLKVVPIALASPDDSEVMIVVRADEPIRLPKLRSRGMLVPLADDGITQSHVQAFWRGADFDLDLQFRDGGTPLGNCDLCFLKGPNQIKSLIASSPSRAIWWASQEKKIGGTFRNDRPSYAAMMDNASSQTDAFGYDESIPCFCGD
jgi:3'-phosphoadenosine 5'-phosphosulfate sulfotransferase (PAPS reductase)/FAD synthetase